MMKYGMILKSKYRNDHQRYLKKIKKKELFIKIIKISILIIFLIFWELLGRLEIINTFLLSYPTKILKTILVLTKENNLLTHIFTTTTEVLISFILSTIIGIIIASIMWLNNTFTKIIDPYLSVINSLPKVAIGPLLIIYFGTDIKTIIILAVLISVFTVILNLYDSFSNTDTYKITLMKSFKATKLQIFTKLVLRGNLNSIINILKINISLSLIGVIMGELLVSKKGLGYLINYACQLFNLNLVITSIFILGVLSYILYIIVSKLELLLKK